MQVTLELCIPVSHVALATHYYYKIKHFYAFLDVSDIYMIATLKDKKKSIFPCHF